MNRVNAFSLFVLNLAFAISVVSCNAPKKTIGETGKQTGGVPIIQHHANPYPVVPQKYFTLTWTGTEICLNEAGGTITLTPKDSMSVYITGLNQQGNKLVGKLRGYMVLIEPENENDPKGNKFIEGSFVLSNDHQTLKGFFNRHMDGKIDSCSAVYHPAQ